MSALMDRPMTTPTTPEPDQADDFGADQLKELRDLGEWSQDEFSKITNYSKSAIKKMEAGRRPVPAPLRRQAVALVEEALNNEIRARQAKLRRLRDR